MAEEQQQGPGGQEQERQYYTREELEEFREIINKKLSQARQELESLKESLENANESSADNFELMEMGTDVTEKENMERLMQRQMKFIDNLERALVRIENGTYGRCKVTGKLISKERLRAVPHTETSIEAKLNRPK
jgi:RNA polymerase-binding protein DksA